MASQPIPMDPKYIIDLIIKRRWIIMVPFFIAMIVGIVLAIKLPKIYEASTLILIQPQRVPENYVQSIVDSDPSTRLSTLSQQVLSRTNLEKIIREFKLFSNEKQQSMYTEDKIANLRKRISVNISSDRRRETDSFSISFQDKDPSTVMNVTNALASYFINENLKQREAQAIGTSDFLDSELQSMKARLEEVEAKLKSYRESYMGELPEQLDSNLRILDRLQEHLGETQQSLSEAKIRLATLQNEAAALREQPTTVIIGQESRQETNDINQMKLELENLLSRYTDRHPDVIRLKSRIAEMEKQIASNPLSDVSSAGSGGSGQSQSGSVSPQYRTQYNEILGEMRRLEADAADTRAQIGIYQKRVEDTPKREQELLSLKRDYQNIQTTYDSLLERKLEAEIAVNMERKQKGEQFRVLDPAKMPQKPVKPDMRKLFIMVVGAGLAIGGGIIFLIEYTNDSFKRPEDVEEDLTLPVLCTVPKIIDSRTRMLRRVEYIASAVFGAIAFVFFAGFALLALVGVEPTLELVKKMIHT
ncbi:chain-length determining protein [Desulfosarcina ovata subsp. sediminis]|uniref:Chain-length determining protein n=1 Tax=Desulfosarcina ovata subsp. sediminis TaxID=885957 RepID=A0A5K7ZMI6_9BACT|nr:XrtA system polysaccharide chain length determinant [Desulfosarcina ovata]BBO81357.1 chain-length determining protein [Desulfosarcina ovata subsp. sediminis]